MKRVLFFLIGIACAKTISAQQDSTTFKATLYNEEYDVTMRINLYDNDVMVPKLDMLGGQPGCLYREKASHYSWIITDADIKNATAELILVNESGSEDLEATLTCKDDSTYVLKQGHGSTMKVPKGTKWQKLPGTITLKRKK